MIDNGYNPSQVQVIQDPPERGVNTQDLAELGAILTGMGLTTIEVRGLLGDVQQAAAQATLNMAPKFLESVRRVTESRYMEMVQRVRALPQRMGWINRDQVLQIIQDVSSRVPRP